MLRGLTSSPKEQRLAVNTVVAFLPAAVIGVFAAGYIKHYLFNPTAVAVALIVGGFIILWVENRIVRLRITPRVAAMDDMSWKDALLVGCMQCLAMIPGTKIKPIHDVKSCYQTKVLIIRENTAANAAAIQADTIHSLF